MLFCFGFSLENMLPIEGEHSVSLNFDWVCTSFKNSMTYHIFIFVYLF